MIVYDTRRAPVTLGKMQARGGEGVVYQVEGRPQALAKIYTPPKPDYHQKLAWMRGNPPVAAPSNGHAAIAWPNDLLYDQHGAFLGYLMPHVRSAVPLFDVFNPRRRAQTLPGFDGRYLHRAARNLAAALAALHARDYVVGDLNESNVLVTPSALVTIIDTDSFQVREMRQAQIVFYPCPVGKPEYTPPELQGKTFVRELRQPENDRFGLGVLIFQMLMEGSHPFRSLWQGEGDPPPVAEKIMKGWFPYARRPLGPVAPPTFSPPLDTLYPGVADLVRRCFEDGHRDPRLRPTPEEWDRVLGEAEKTLQSCRNGHVYSGHLNSCPTCGGAARRPAIRSTPRQTSQPKTVQATAKQAAPVAASSPAQPPPSGPAAQSSAKPSATRPAPSRAQPVASPPNRPPTQRPVPPPVQPTRSSPPPRVGPTMTLPPISPFSGMRRRILWEFVRAWFVSWMMSQMGLKTRPATTPAAPPRPTPSPSYQPRRWAIPEPVKRTAALTAVVVSTAGALIFGGDILAATASRLPALSLPALQAPSLNAPSPASVPLGERRLVRVDARQGWQWTGLNASAGARISFEVVSGQWTSQKIVTPYTGASGTGWICGRETSPSQCAEPAPNASTGSLIVKIGEQVTAVPTEGGYISDHPGGQLWLRINDADAGLTDNDGELQVRVIVVPQPSVQPPK